VQGTFARMDWFTASFGTKDHVDLAQECARAALIFFFGLILLRLAGRRISGKWSGLDIIVSVLIGSNLSRALTGTAPLLGTLAACAVLVALHWLTSHLAALRPWLSHLLEGKPIMLASDGRLDRRQVVKRAISEADLNENLRAAGIEDIGTTRKVVLEPSGRLTVLKR